MGQNPTWCALLTFAQLIRCLHECKNDCAIEYIDLHSGKRHFADVETRSRRKR